MADSLNNSPARNSRASQRNDDWGLDEASERLSEQTEESLAPKGEAESDQTERIDEDQHFRPGATKRRPRFWGLALILLIVIGAGIVAIIGAIDRGEWSTFFRRVSLHPAPKMVLLESRGEKSLLLQIDGDRRQVMVQLPDRDGWVVVSRDDFTAANPALSPDGAWVAYLSTQNAPEVEIVPLEQSGRVTYTSAGLRGFCQREGLAKMSICPWTPVAWSMDSTRLAFFGCTTEPPTSQAFVIDLSASGLTLQTSIITDTEATGADPRQISWIGSDQVLVTFPPTANAETETVTTIPVPPANE